MEFIRKNYEKIILGAVLLGLVGVLAFMPVVILYDQEKMRDLRTNTFPIKLMPLPALDMSRQKAVLDRLSAPYELDFSTTNKLFNPVQWQKDKDGTLIKITTGHEIGPDAAIVTKITPLYLYHHAESVETNGIAAALFREHRGSNGGDSGAAPQAAPLRFEGRNSDGQNGGRQKRGLHTY